MIKGTNFMKPSRPRLGSIGRLTGDNFRYRARLPRRVVSVAGPLTAQMMQGRPGHQSRPAWAMGQPGARIGSEITKRHAQGNQDISDRSTVYRNKASAYQV